MTCSKCGLTAMKYFFDTSSGMFCADCWKIYIAIASSSLPWRVSEVLLVAPIEGTVAVANATASAH